MHCRVPATVAILSTIALLPALAGCSTASAGGAGNDPSSGESGTRTITDVQGKQEIPTNPGRIVAVDENAALNLLSIGITPDVAFDSWNTEVPAKVIEAAGVKVVHVDASTYYPALETVAAQKPDLIVGTDANQGGTQLPDYDKVAPTVHALFTDTWQNVVTAYGKYFDARAKAEQVIAALTDDVEAVKAAQPSDPLSISVLQSYSEGNLLLDMDTTNNLSSVIADAGFTRPAAETEDVDSSKSYGGWSQFSPENLREHDADVMAIADAANYDPKGVTGLAVYPTLNVVKDGNAKTVDGDFWTGGYGFATYWVIADLQSAADGDFTPGTAADATDRWKAFEQEIGQA